MDKDFHDGDYIDFQVRQYQTNIHMRSPETLSKMAKKRVLAIVGASASGKSSLARMTFHMFPDDVGVVQNETSRDPRESEKAGQSEYIFRAVAEIEDDLNNGRLVEVTKYPPGPLPPNVKPNLYCTRPDGYPDDKVGLLPTLSAELAHLRILPFRSFSEVFIVPSFDEWMVWLENQAIDGSWTDAQKMRRLDEALDSYHNSLNSTYMRFIINDTLENAADKIHRLVIGDQLLGESDAKKMAEDNYQRLKQLLGK
jgi:guanylate kinase